MNKPKHASGLWEHISDAGINKVRLLGSTGSNSSEGLIAIVYGEGMEDIIANRELIAAAPELLRALKEMIYEQCKMYCANDDSPCDTGCWVKKNKELVARVKGETE